MLKYALRENLLTSEPDDFTAQVTDNRSYSLEEVIDRMMERGTTLTRGDVAAVMQVYGETVSSIVADGGSVNTPLMNTSMSISGVFAGAGDSFDPSRHSLNINIAPGSLLKEALGKVRTEKVEAASTAPHITEVKDVVSGAVNSTLTAGGILQIAGNRLKFDAADEAQGVFLVPETGDAVRCGVVAENKPSKVTVMIPADLAAATYYVEIRTKVSSAGREGKTLKVGRFEKPLKAG